MHFLSPLSFCGAHIKRTTTQQNFRLGIQFLFIFPLVRRSGSVANVLAQHVVKNAIDLVVRTRRSRANVRLDRVGPLIEPDQIVSQIESSVAEEAHCLACETPDVLLMIADRITASAIAEQAKRDRIADWDNAPPLRPSSSKTALYVANTIVEVVEQLKSQGLMTPGMRELAADSCVTRAATEASLRGTVQDVMSMPGGAEMLQLAVGLLRDKHSSLPDGGTDRTWEQLGAGLVASLIRVAIVQVRDVLQHGQVGDADLAVLASTAEFGAANDTGDVATRYSTTHGEWRENRRESRPQAALQRKIAEQGILVSSNSITQMIADAVHKVTAESSNVQIDDAVRDHITRAAQQFISKIIDDVFADAQLHH